ncbi:putative endopeptidase Spr precursor [Weissella cibaria]|uniref:Spr protein n=2 Tax=Weissella cibaria TaxID=137591 RepID=A0A0D1M120_9LACO|nr:putative endopeptidase Spr precursor [Weissella cibaria]KIU24557.1 putative endopeptidase Spr precursor [Weissella cibaria]KIU25087.1 putative endopeptidase Spr precursor [Weissella cibaria]
MSYWVVTLKTSKTGVMLNMTLFKGKKALAFIASVIASFTFAMGMEADHSASAAGQTGYVSTNEGWRWLENGQKYTGFRFYMGTYYWFIDGVRQDSGWREAWGMKYYTDNEGRAVQGNYVIDGTAYNFGDNGTFFLRGKTSGYTDAGQGWKWYENGQQFTGFRFYMGTYYWFENGVREQNKWKTAWGMKYYVDNVGRAVEGTRIIDGKSYYFGNDGTFFLRDSDAGTRMIEEANHWLGIPYMWGGATQYGVDCSGFIRLVRQHAHLTDLGRTTYEQAAYLRAHGSQPKPLSQAQPGDLLFWGSVGGEYHVGMYIGNGKMIDAPQPGMTTGVHDIWDAPLAYHTI